MFGGTRVVYITPKRLGPGSFWAKAAPLFIRAPTAALNARGVLSVCRVIVPTIPMMFRMLQRSVLVAWPEVQRGPYQ
jgi:hypothetical protein